MDKEKLEQSIQALKGAATAIASAIEEESITGQQVYCMLRLIADQLEGLCPPQIAPAT